MCFERFRALLDDMDYDDGPVKTGNKSCKDYTGMELEDCCYNNWVESNRPYCSEYWKNWSDDDGDEWIWLMLLFSAELPWYMSDTGLLKIFSFLLMIELIKEGVVLAEWRHYQREIRQIWYFWINKYVLLRGSPLFLMISADSYEYEYLESFFFFYQISLRKERKRFCNYRPVH